MVLLPNTRSQASRINHIIQIVVLGIVQGLTEFLPISSSAHLRLLGEFLPNAKDPGAAFTAITQIGTELAVILYFWREITQIITSWFSFNVLRRNDLSPDQRESNRIGWYVIIGSIPVFILGFLLQDSIKTTFRSLLLVGVMILVFGLILGIADYIGHSGSGLRDLKASSALLFGFGQSLALIPGVSRSGATIAVGRFMGFNRSAATKFSFLLAIPAVLGSGLYELYQTLKSPATEVYSMPETLLATVIAFFVGYAVIAWLMKFIASNSYKPFVIYRTILGSAVIIATLTNVIGK